MKSADSSAKLLRSDGKEESEGWPGAPSAGGYPCLGKKRGKRSTTKEKEEREKTRPERTLGWEPSKKKRQARPPAGRKFFELLKRGGREEVQPRRG